MRENPAKTVQFMTVCAFAFGHRPCLARSHHTIMESHPRADNELSSLLSDGLILWRYASAGRNDLWCMVFELPDGYYFVVDDDPVVRRLVSVLFGHDGHAVDQAADGSEGLRLALGGDYDLVICDRRAAAGSEPFLVALLRARPAWRNRAIVAAAERISAGAVF